MINISRIKNASSLKKDINCTINIDLETLTNEMNKLKSMLENPKSKQDKNNIKRIIDYLDDFDETNNINWQFDSERCEFVPNKDIVKIKEYGIDVLNLMYRRPTQFIVCIDTYKILKCIVFNYMLFESGKSSKDIQEIMNGTSYIGNNNIEDIADKMNNAEIDSMYLKAKRNDYNKKQPNSPFLDYEEKKFKGYFNSITYKNYINAIDDSVIRINSEIVSSIINDNNIKIGLIRISQYDIVFIIDNKDIGNLQLPSASIQVFDRKFTFETKNNIIIL